MANTDKTKPDKTRDKAEETKPEKTQKPEKEKKAAKPEEKAEKAKAAKKEAKKEVQASPKLKKVIEEIENLSVVELADLVNALQERFGVTAAGLGVAMAAPAAGPAPAAEGLGTEQTTFNVVLTESGTNKISVIKVIKGLIPDLGLKEAKDLVESAPKEVLNGVNKERADEAKQKLEEAGAKVEFK